MNWHQRAGYHGMYPVVEYDPELPQSAAGNQFAGANQAQTTGMETYQGAPGDYRVGGYDDPMREVTDPRWPSLADSVHTLASPIVAEHQQPWNLFRASDVAQKALMGFGSSSGAAPFVEGAVYGTGGPSPASIAAGSRSESRRAPEIRQLPGGYRRGGGYGAAANRMGSMRGRFADLRGIHSQTHGGGHASDRRPVLVHERSYYTDEWVPGRLQASLRRP